LWLTWLSNLFSIFEKKRKKKLDKKKVTAKYAPGVIKRDVLPTMTLFLT